MRAAFHHFIRLILLSFLLACPLLAQTDSTAPSKIVELHDVIFGKGGMEDLHAEIAYRSDATKPMPAIIYVHGGGWISGSQKDAPLRQIAQAGFFGASIEYRLSNVGKWPAQIEDCKLGVRWLRANAAKYGVDPNRIGAWGASAGGHLVACLGTMADQKEFEGDGGYPGTSSAVQAVVDFFGPTDFTLPASYLPQALQVAEGLFGVPYDADQARWKSGSPLFYVKAGDPPMLLVHGDADQLVPIRQSVLLDDALAKAHVPHQFIVVKNGGHGFAPLPGTAIDPSNAQIDAAVFAFFAKYLKKP